MLLAKDRILNESTRAVPRGGVKFDIYDFLVLNASFESILESVK